MDIEHCLIPELRKVISPCGHTDTNRCVSSALVTYSAADQGRDHVEVANEVPRIEVSRSRRCPERELA